MTTDELVEAIDHAIDMMHAIRDNHPEIPDEGWRELNAVINHLRGTLTAHTQGLTGDRLNGD